MKRKFLALFLVLTLFVSLVPGFFSKPAAAAVASSVSDARDKIAQSQERQQKLQTQLNAAKEKKESYLEQKEIIEQQVGELADEIAVYDSLIADLDGKISTLEAEIDSAQATYNANIEKYKVRARATYEQGETTYLDILLGSGSFSDFLLRLDYVKQDSLYSKKLLGTISDSIQIIKENKAEVEINRSELTTARDEVSERKAEVDKKNSEITRLVNAAKSSENALKAALEKEMDLEDDLNEWMQKQSSGSAGSDIVYQPGEWMWPVAKASYNYVSSGYGYRTLNGKRKFHYAIDIAAPRGTNIYASKAGRVSYSGWATGGCGWTVKIDHGGGYETWYLHMNSRPIVSVGQQVKQGQVIGYVGMTGGTSTGYHLDIRFYVNNKAQNPLNYLVKPSWLTR